MDIEGSEFKVIPQILASGIEIGQILVELHERFTPNPQKTFEDTMEQFREAGYKLIYVSGSAEEFSFVK